MNSSLETKDTAAARKLPDAFQRNGEARPSCVFCRAEIVDNQWFCRLAKNGNGDAHAENVSILLCSPRCALRHFASSRSRENGIQSDHERYERMFGFLMDGEVLA
jgi:hypothetical protein